MNLLRGVCVCVFACLCLSGVSVCVCVEMEGNENYLTFWHYIIKHCKLIMHTLDPLLIISHFSRIPGSLY